MENKWLFNAQSPVQIQIFIAIYEGKFKSKVPDFFFHA